MSEEAEILMPDRQVTLAGETITVREFTFAQELEALPLAAGIIERLADLFADGGDPDFTEVEAALYAEPEPFVRLLALSTGKPEAWIRDLPGADGQTLAMTFWSVNRRFFIGRVVARTLALRPELAESLSASANSSAH